MGIRNEDPGHPHLVITGLPCSALIGGAKSFYLLGAVRRYQEEVCVCCIINKVSNNRSYSECAVVPFHRHFALGTPIHAVRCRSGPCRGFVTRQTSYHCCPDTPSRTPQPNHEALLSIIITTVHHTRYNI